jgi:RNA polymerase sigma-70 factor (ECF subfamily)
MLSLEDEQSDRAFRVDGDPVDDIGRRRDVDLLRRAVIGLPVRYREAVVLCDLQELSYADAAAALGCAVGTIRSRLHRGRALLARRLCRDGATHPCPLQVTRTMP